MLQGERPGLASSCSDRKRRFKLIWQKLSEGNSWPALQSLRWAAEGGDRPHSSFGGHSCPLPHREQLLSQRDVTLWLGRLQEPPSSCQACSELTPRGLCREGQGLEGRWLVQVGETLLTNSLGGRVRQHLGIRGLIAEARLSLLYKFIKSLKAQGLLVRSQARAVSKIPGSPVTALLQGQQGRGSAGRPGLCPAVSPAAALALVGGTCHAAGAGEAVSMEGSSSGECSGAGCVEGRWSGGGCRLSPGPGCP